MQTKDPSLWEKQRIELEADETSKRFLEVFLDWFDGAEELYEAVTRADPDQRLSVISAVRHQLSRVEQDRAMFLSMEWCGQQLLLAWQHWIHGDEMYLGMTNMERRMLEQMSAIKLAELQEQSEGL